MMKTLVIALAAAFALGAPLVANAQDKSRDHRAKKPESTDHRAKKKKKKRPATKGTTVRDHRKVKPRVRDRGGKGVTRDHNEGRGVEYLEYEAYRPMADNKIREIIAEMRDRFDVDLISIAHRTGRVDIGEKSMVVAVSAEHRRPAFEAALYFVDRLKEIVPIWKKEHFDGGEVWINDTPG